MEGKSTYRMLYAKSDAEGKIPIMVIADPSIYGDALSIEIHGFYQGKRVTSAHQLMDKDAVKELRDALTSWLDGQEVG